MQQRILLTIGISFLALLGFMIPNVDAGGIAAYYVGPGETYEALLDGQTYTIVNSTAYTIYIPARTLAEQQSFINNLPSGVTASSGITDIDGNVYGTVVIGTQTWITSNLMTTRYNNGTAITRGPVGATWSGDNGYYAYPSNTANSAEETLPNIISNNLGFIYQWSAAANPNICPNGWHVPSDEDWRILEGYVGKARITNGYDCVPAGDNLKEVGTTHWINNLGSTTNSSGFTAIGSGYRWTNGAFYGRSTASYFWSSTAYTSPGTAVHRGLVGNLDGIDRSSAYNSCGYSVRCVKN